MGRSRMRVTIERIFSRVASLRTKAVIAAVLTASVCVTAFAAIAAAGVTDMLYDLDYEKNREILGLKLAFHELRTSDP